MKTNPHQNAQTINQAAIWKSKSLGIIMRIASSFGILWAGVSYAIGLITPLEDPNASDKYDISYVTHEYWKENIENNATMMSKSYMLHIGDGLSCCIPQHSDDSLSSNQERDELEFHELLEDNLQKSIDIIVNSGEKCVMFKSDFWTYEYCPYNQLSQFHGNPATTQLYYVLARPKQVIEDRVFQLLYNNFNYYISEIVDSGDICDLTGNPRVVEIQYVCAAATDSATIQWIKEVKTCYYEVQIAIPKLCELELLSSTEDKKMSNPVLCINQKNENTGIVNIIGNYEPLFVGSDFYLLEPHESSTVDHRKVLLYSGKHKMKDGFVEGSAELYENIGSAFTRMLFQQLLMPPCEIPYRPGDEFSWVSAILDLQGNFLTRLQFNLSSSSLADITLDSSIQFPKKGNLIYHRHSSDQNNAEKTEELGTQAKIRKLKNLKTKKDVKLVIMDESQNVPQFLDVSDAQDLFEELLTSEQLAAIFDEQDEDAEEENPFNNIVIRGDSNSEDEAGHPVNEPEENSNQLKNEEKRSMTIPQSDGKSENDGQVNSPPRRMEEESQEIHDGDESGDEHKGLKTQLHDEL